MDNMHIAPAVLRKQLNDLGLTDEEALAVTMRAWADGRLPVLGYQQRQFETDRPMPPELSNLNERRLSTVYEHLTCDEEHFLRATGDEPEPGWRFTFRWEDASVTYVFEDESGWIRIDQKHLSINRIKADELIQQVGDAGAIEYLTRHNIRGGRLTRDEMRSWIEAQLAAPGRQINKATGPKRQRAAFGRRAWTKLAWQELWDEITEGKFGPGRPRRP